MKVFQTKVLIIPEEQDSGNRETLFLSASLMKRWRLKKGDVVSLEAGIKKYRLMISSQDRTGNQMLIPADAKRHLSLPELPHPVLVSCFPNENRLSIGPVFALLTNHTPKSSNGTFGDLEIFYRELFEYCLEKGYIFYLLALQPLDNQTELIGAQPVEDGWITSIFPVPQVIYNRIPSRKLEHSKEFQRFVQSLSEQSIPFFNEGFLSKWEVHNILSENEALLPHLPETMPLDSEEEFLQFLSRYPAVYVKPVFGSQGQNICKLTRTAEGWVLEHSSDVLETRLFQTEEALFRLFQKQKRKRTYIVQQGISLYETDHKKTDFRVLLIRNKQHQWKITSIVARTGYAGHIVSNLSKGGNMQNGREFLLANFDPAEAAGLYRALSVLALNTAESLGKSQDGLFAELGVDLALDAECRPWIIEVNSKPSKRYSGSRDRFRPSVRRIIDYMEALSKQDDGSL